MGRLYSQNESHKQSRIPLWLGCYAAVLGSAFTVGYNMSSSNQIQSFVICWLQNSKYKSNFNCSDAIELDQAKTFDQVNVFWSLCSSMVPLGAGIGAFFGAPIGNYFGKKTTMIGNSLLNLACSVGLACAQLADSVVLYVTLRLVMGLAVGIHSAVAPAYLGEISPESLKGPFGSSYQFGAMSGVLVASILGLPWLAGTADRWIYVYGAGAIISALEVLALIFTYESPVFYLMKGDTDRANFVAQKFQTDEYKQLYKDDVSDESIFKNMKRIFTKPSLQRATIFACTLLFWQQFSGVNAIVFYSARIFTDIGLSFKTASIGNVGLMTCNLLGCIVPLFLVNRINRRSLMLFSMVVYTLTLIIQTILLSINANVAGYISLGNIAVSLFIYNVGFGPLPWATSADVMPKEYRAGTSALVATTHWLCLFVVAFVFPILQESISQYVFVIFTGFMVGAIAYVWFRMPETKDKSVNELQEIFAKRSCIF